MRILFLFLDGIGLGSDDPQINPFAAAKSPHLQELLGGQRLLAQTAPYEGELASLLALDACLGVDGLPQSATGQATLLTGINVPAAIGYHYGPKPNPPVAEFLKNGNLFFKLKNHLRQAALLSAYPPRYFEAIASGLRMYSAIPLAVTIAGIPLKSARDLSAGRALAADFTGQGWHEHLGLSEIPVLTPRQAGKRLGEIAQTYDLAFFEYWLTDYAGHRQRMSDALAVLENIDQVMGGLVEKWNTEDGLILLTSDHGNLEDLSTRRHTTNPVPALLIGSRENRREFSVKLQDLADVTPAILRSFLID
jgi:2,3-bisphosphoglycerate-independent phosphoglycerate mutase